MQELAPKDKDKDKDLTFKDKDKDLIHKDQDKNLQQRRKQIAHQLRTQYVEGIYSNPLTLKSRLTVTQGH